MSTTQIVAAFTIALAASVSAFAQERLEIFTLVDGRPSLVELDGTVSGFGRVLAVQPLPALPYVPGVVTSASPSVSVVSGGRFLAWTTPQYVGGTLMAFDLRTRQLFDAASILPRDWHGGPVSGVRVLGADPLRPRLFLSSQFGLGFPQRFATWTLDLETLTATQTGTQDYQVVASTFAAKADRLFFWDMTLDASLNTQRWIVTIDASTGQEVRRWLFSNPPGSMHTDPDGRYLWVDRNGSLERLDAQTGATLAQAPQFSSEHVTSDEARGLLLVRQGDFLAALDPLTLIETGRVRVAYSPAVPDRTFASQTVGGAGMTGAYTLRAEAFTRVVRSGRTGREDIVEVLCTTLAVDALDTGGSRRASADLLAALDPRGQTGTRDATLPCSAFAIAVRSPLAPTSQPAGVTASNVTLSWSDPGNASSFELEFGMAPGQRLGTVAVGRVATTNVQGVPPGVYYVRVRAINEVGRSPASNEIRVVVP